MKNMILIFAAILIAMSFTSCKKECGTQFAITVGAGGIYNGNYVNSNYYGYNYGNINTGINLQVGMVLYFEECNGVATYTGNCNNCGNSNNGGNTTCSDEGFQITGALVPNVFANDGNGNMCVGDAFWGFEYSPAGTEGPYYVMCDPQWITITGKGPTHYSYVVSDSTFTSYNGGVPCWIPSNNGGGGIVKTKINEGVVLDQTFVKVFTGPKSCAY